MSSPKQRKRPGQGAPDNPQKRAVNTRTPAAAQGLAANPRFRARVERFWEFGPGIAALLLARLAAEHDCRPQIEKYLDACIENAAAIKAYGLGWPGAAP